MERIYKLKPGALPRWYDFFMPLLVFLPFFILGLTNYELLGVVITGGSLLIISTVSFIMAKLIFYFAEPYYRVSDEGIARRKKKIVKWERIIKVEKSAIPVGGTKVIYKAEKKP